MFSRRDRHHDAAKEFLQADFGQMITNLPVIVEVLFLLGFSVEAQTDFLTWASGALDIDGETVSDLPRIIEITKKYADLPADFADASLVALCERRGIDTVATLDKHFEVYRTSARKQLKNAFVTRRMGK